MSKFTVSKEQPKHNDKTHKDTEKSPKHDKKQLCLNCRGGCMVDKPDIDKPLPDEPDIINPDVDPALPDVDPEVDPEDIPDGTEKLR